MFMGFFLLFFHSKFNEIKLNLLYWLPGDRGSVLITETAFDSKGNEKNATVFQPLKYSNEAESGSKSTKDFLRCLTVALTHFILK